MVRTLGLVLILGVFYLGFSVQTQQKREPDAEIARKLALRCRQLLDTSVVRFFLPACLNTEQGGYYETWKAGKFVSTGSQFVTQQARTLWFCSTLAREGINRECTLKAAHHGYTHLQKAFLDEKHGGYFSKVRDDDEPLDLRKHVYLQSFVLYGLSAYYRASNDATALQAAKALFTLLEKHAYDKAHGGYNEFFYRDWEFIRDTGEPIYVGPIGCKTYNTHLHILEAYTELYRIWPDALVKERLLELIHIITAKMRHRLHAFHLDQWQQDWQQIETPQNNRASYGHDLECTWLVQEAWRVLEIPVETQRAWIQEVVDYSLRFGYDEKHGGFFMGGKPGEPADDTRKEWWVQAEALVGLLEAYTLLEDIRYWQAFLKTLDFIEKYQIATEGGWRATLEADGRVIRDERASMWQGPYHTGRALLHCAKILESQRLPLSIRK